MSYQDRVKERKAKQSTQPGPEEGPPDDHGDAWEGDPPPPEWPIPIPLSGGLSPVAPFDYSLLPDSFRP